jgi:nickel-dependent lactate racemase
VVTSAGGYPLDATLYQSSKGLLTAAQMLKPGGNIIWIAGCEIGVGGVEFQDMVAGCEDYQDFKAKYQDPDNFTIDQWGAQAYFRAMQKAGKVWLYSPGMNYVQARKFKLTKVESLNALFAGLASTSQKIHLLPEGPYMACKM